MPDCDAGENLRLVCMGKGYLTPDSRSLQDCEVPVFKTHPTPVNVSVKPQKPTVEVEKKDQKRSGGHHSGVLSGSNNEVGQGCGCVIM